MLPWGYLTSVLGVISHSPDSLMVTSSVVGPSILASVMPCGWGPAARGAQRSRDARPPRLTPMGPAGTLTTRATLPWTREVKA